jgi:predicted MPP superfamily phosphohydrolase
VVRPALRVRLGRCAGYALFLCALAALWAFLIEPRMLRVREQALALKGWPEPLAGLRVAVLTDLHVGSPGNGLDNLARVVDETLAQKPDLVLIAGDLVIQGVVFGSFVPPEEAAKVLARLKAPLGTFAVLGNHDHWLDAARVTRALEAQGIAVLEDQARPLRFRGHGFWLAGVSDFWEGDHDLAGALGQVTDSGPIVVFTHNPDLLPEVPARVALTIAGHTHGGQVWLPLLGRPIVPSAYGQRFAIGHVVESGRDLFVASGVGTSILPVRFCVPPEVSVVELRQASRRP